MSGDGKTALYYPHVHFRSQEWLRASLLYYDHLSRIIPPDVVVDSHEYYAEFLKNPSPLLNDVQALVAGGFLVEDRPAPFIGEVADEFFDFAMEHLQDAKQRASLIPQLANRKSFYTIHPAKIDSNLAQILVHLQLAHKKQGDPYSDLDIEPVTGGLYMLFLASRMAGIRNLVSDSSVYQALLYQPLPDATASQPSRGSREFRLATAVLKTAVPTRMEKVPIEKLLRVHSDLSRQRTRFQDKIAALARDLENVDGEEAAQATIDVHQRKLEDDYQELIDKLRSANIAFGTGLFAISVPSWATATWGLAIASMTPVLAGLGAIGISALVMKNIFDRKAAKRTNPASYLLSLRKRLTVRSMAEDIITLNLSGFEDSDSRGRFDHEPATSRSRHKSVEPL
jgi:hypothetical protein